MNKLQDKYLHLLEVYRDEVSEANYPYSEKSGQYPEKHPFEDAPAAAADWKVRRPACPSSRVQRVLSLSASTRVSHARSFFL